MKGEGAEIKNDLYVLVHSCGMVFDFRQVTGSVKGKVDQNLLPEGISQVVLMDKEGNVYSQLSIFYKKEAFRIDDFIEQKTLPGPRVG